MNTVVLDYLEKQGYKNISTDYYDTYIQNWENWWRNQVKFHKYHDQTGKKRKMYVLGMAKRVAEDWASILFTERDEITTTAKTKLKTEANNKFLNEQLKVLKVYDDLPIAIEKAMAMGTAGSILRVRHAKVDKDNNLIVDNRTKLDLIYVEAKQIIPLRVEHGSIIDVAFVSESNKGDDKEYYVETHILKYNEKLGQDTYEITNTYLDKEGHEIDKKGIANKININSSVPLFSIMTPALANPIDSDYNIINGLGYSVFGSAIDQLKVCDITYNNFAMDFYLGGKKVFYNQKIVKQKPQLVRDLNGNVKERLVDVYPDDITRQQWATYGNEMANLNAEPAIKEYNPELRTEEDKEGIQFALDMLSFKCGLGTKYYQFNGSTGQVTATQYVGERQDLIDNANKHRKKVDEFVAGICKGLLLLGRILFKQDVTEDCEINITDKDGFMVDTETAKAEFRQDIAQGIRKAWEYRVKFLGETEEIAKARVADKEIEDIELENKNEKDEE